MARKVRVILVGDGALKEHLRELTSAESKKAILGAVRESVKIIQKEAQSLAPKRTGALKRSIRVRSIRRSRKRIGVRVTSGAADNLYAGRTFYGAFQEFGWKTGSRKGGRPIKLGESYVTVEPGKKPYTRKPVVGKHFMKQAADRRKSDALEMFNARIRDHVRKVMAKRK